MRYIVPAAPAPDDGELRMSGISRYPRLGKEFVSIHDFPGCQKPVLREARLPGAHRWSFNADLNIPPLVFVFGRPEPVIRKPRSASECDLAVDDQRLAAIPLIRSMERVPLNGTKPGELAAARLEDFENARADCG
jgi:hypothetical protein